jgi:hypothetical protein
MTYISRLFWRETFERGVKTAAQAAIIAIGQDVGGFDVFDASFADVAGFAAGGFVLSVLTSIASRHIGPSDNNPSVV